MQRYDVAVIGLGAMGSAIAAQCAQRGMRVVGFERFGRLHAFGSSAGRSRMIRAAYYEHPAYVPLALGAFDAWRALERESGSRLLHITGLLMIGGPESALLSGALQSAREHKLCVEHLDAAELRKRFPMFAASANEYGIYEPGGGFVVPESAIAVFLQRAMEAGATLEFERQASIEQARACASKVILAPGAWLGEFDLGIPFVVERNVQHWFKPQRPDIFVAGSCPSFLFERPAFGRPLYGFPDYGFGVKAAFHGSGCRTDPLRLDRTVHQDDVTAVRAALDQALPGAAGDYLAGKVCMYELSADQHFIIATHPRDADVLVVAGFSGHGFKFAPVIGQIVADMATGVRPRYDVDFFSLRRFAMS